MTTTELRDKLVQQYNETVVNVQRLEGAIAALNQVLESESLEETTEETDD